jgi:hypothetical protein
VTLCRADHTFYTENPKLWRSFIESQFPGLWTRLVHREIALERVGAGVDIAAVIRGVREAGLA